MHDVVDRKFDFGEDMHSEESSSAKRESANYASPSKVSPKRFAEPCQHVLLACWA